MQFQRLRLSGFKSFVDQTEFQIGPGLTGVVGPNGCGKSNLLEALRWVMGATSAKAMRGDGMDDVIFGGTEGRPSRNHAEVLLQIDNADRTAPAQFNAHPVIEVARRIDRGAGSTYRVNGVETRARDVQLLFADAATGANSPALVRQGQISELISAKPSNRRRILEDAAGVAGLHSRRHEAELRLKAAEANLDRLSDVAGELETGLTRLRREARQAERYRRLAAEIRHLQAAVYVARWRDAEAQRLEAAEDLKTATVAVEEGERACAGAVAAAALAAADLKPARDEAVVSAAVHQKLLADQGRLGLQQSQAVAELDRARSERRRILEDLDRERQVLGDAETSRSRATDDLGAVERAIAAAPERGPELQAALARAATARASSDQELVVLSAAAAAHAARREGAEERRRNAQARLAAAQTRVAETEGRAARARRTISEARRELDLLAPDGTARTSAESAVEDASERLKEARSQIDLLEARRADAARDEAEARDEERALDDRLRSLRTEAEALRRLTAKTAASDAPILDDVRIARGYETAVAAALGEDLQASCTPEAPRFWAGAEVRPPAWPEGVRPLSEFVDAPAALFARLAYTALVDAAAGERLRKAAPPGARLVSKEGDLWRWDGFTQKAGGASAAAAQLEHRARLEELSADLAALEPRHARASAARRAAAEALRVVETDLKTARAAPRPLEAAVEAARRDLDAAVRRDAQTEARARALQEVIARGLEEESLIAEALELDLRERDLAAEALGEASIPMADAEGPDTAALGAARLSAIEARNEETRVRSVVDQEERAAAGRLRRRDALRQEVQDWTRRADQARSRTAALATSLKAAEDALAAAADAPEVLAAALETLLSDLATAERRRRRAEDALAAAEQRASAGDQAVRTREAVLAKAREARAAAEARSGAARDAEKAAADNLRRGLGEEPQTVADRLGEQAFAVPADVAGVEGHLANLERERDGMGPVNLRAEEDAQELAQRLKTMAAERQDLLSAIARLRAGVHDLNEEGRERLQAAFTVINDHFKSLFETLFEGGEAELRLVESDDPLNAGLEIFARPPGKRLATMSLMSGGEQALTAVALIFAVFLANPSPVCVLDEVDAPLDDANVDRFCRLLDEMRRRTETRFIAITHNPVTMSRVDRLFGVTMPERGISQLVSINLRQAEALAAE